MLRNLVSARALSFGAEPVNVIHDRSDSTFYNIPTPLLITTIHNSRNNEAGVHQRSLL